MSYGLSLDALQDFLPIDLSLDVKTVRYDTLKVAKRLEAEESMENLGMMPHRASPCPPWRVSPGRWGSAGFARRGNDAGPSIEVR